MTPLSFLLATTGFALLAGLLGSLLGLGGGIIIVPALTLVLGVDIRFAIGASLVAVIATSSGAAAGYVRERLSNIRVAMLLETATVAGALSGAFLAGHVPTRWLYILFGAVMAYSAWVMFRRTWEQEVPPPGPPDQLADRLRLHSSFEDPRTGLRVPYRVARTKIGLVLMYFAGIVSGLLGVGAGIMKVPTLDVAMRLPLKASTSTSNFMMGVTAAGSAALYFARGLVDPLVAAPVAVGVLAGALLGSHLLRRIESSALRWLFCVVLVYVCYQMLSKGFSS